MVKVRVKRAYYDKERGCYPKIGEVFEADEGRAAVLAGKGVCEIADPEEPAEEPPGDTPKKEKQQKKAAKKAEA